jgi:hypothetical protein
MFQAKLTNEAIKAKRQCFRSFLLLKSNNLGTAASGPFEYMDNPFFSHLFIDEAAQATEPEILCPLSCVVDPYPGGKLVEVGFIGDPRQLSPQIFSDESAKYGLGRSFMERLLRRPVECMGGGGEDMLGSPTKKDTLFNDAESSLMDLIRYYSSVDGRGQDESLTIFLTENYRGHPAFLMVRAHCTSFLLCVYERSLMLPLANSKMTSSFFYYDRLGCAKDLNDEVRQLWCGRLREIESTSKAVMPKEDTRSLNDFFRVVKQTTWPIHFLGVAVRLFRGVLCLEVLWF